MIDPRFFELLKYLYRGGSYGLYWKPGDDDNDDDESLSRWFPCDDPPEVPKLWAAKYDTYFNVHPSNIRRSEHRRISIGDVEVINGFFSDLDYDTPEEKQQGLETIRSWPIKPAVIVDSGGGLQPYWLIRNTFPLDTDEKRVHARDLQKAWVEHTGGDDGAKDIARILRIPGTTNWKPDYAPNFPEVKILDFDLSVVHDLSDIETAVQPIIDGWAAKKAQGGPQAAGGGAVNLDDQELIDRARNSPKSGARFTRLWNGDTSDHGGDDSKADQDLCNLLVFWIGPSADYDRVDRLFRQSGLMREDKWGAREKYRRDTISKAINSAMKYYDPNYSSKNPSLAVQAAQAAVGNNGIPPSNGTGPAMRNFFLTESADHEGNARCVEHLHGEEFRYCPAIGWLWYNGKHWEAENAESYLDRAIIDTLIQRRLAAVGANQENIVRKTEGSSYNVAGTKKLFQSMVVVSVSAFDADPDFLNCVNGVVDLRTGQIEAHNAGQLFTYCVPVDYDPSADYVEWVEFLHQVLPEPAMADYLKMAMGYSATGHTREECLFYVHGPTRSGKGTFTETLLTLLPKPLGVQADFATFTAKREGDTQNFDLAPLKPARFIVASESGKYETLNEAKVKTVTGGDWVRCAYKHRDHFEYRPQFKIWLISNHPISGDVDDAAFWGRVRVIDFPNSFLGREDKRLKQEMKSKKNLEGVLAWMVEGAREWFACLHGLPIPDAVQTATDKARTDLDYVQQWLDECCDADPTAKTWTINDNIYQSYRGWCQQNGITPKGNKQFGRSLSVKGFKTRVQKRLPSGKRAWGVLGITII